MQRKAFLPVPYLQHLLEDGWREKLSDAPPISVMVITAAKNALVAYSAGKKSTVQQSSRIEINDLTRKCPLLPSFFLFGVAKGTARINIHDNRLLIPTFF